MTSKIIVNNIGSDTGINTVTFDSNVVRGGSNLHSTGLALGAGSTVGAVTGVTTYYGDGSQLTGISVDTTKIETNNTKVETIDTSSDSHVKVTIDGSERLRINTLGVTTITSSSNEELFRIQTSFGNSGAVQGKALMGFDHFSVSQKPAILIGSEEDGNASHKGSFVIKLKDAAATDDDPVERFRISSEGYVTKPYNPVFMAYRTSNYATTTSASVLVFDNEKIDVGGNYDVSNGRFTAPVTGLYEFGYASIASNTQTVYRYDLRINGSIPYSGMRQELRIDQNGVTQYGTNGEFCLYINMTAGQYAEVYVYSDSAVSTVYGATSYGYTYFRGRLIQ